MFFPYTILASISFYINVPFTGHIYPFISTFFACVYVDYLLFITYFNVTRKGRIYYWNIFGLSLCSVCQDNIGHRLLQKHGWKLGQGLGKSLQGKFFKFTKMMTTTMIIKKKWENVYEANLVSRCICCLFKQVLVFSHFFPARIACFSFNLKSLYNLPPCSSVSGENKLLCH